MKTSNCHAIGSMLMAFDDGELAAADVAIVEAHLQDCAACRRELGALRRSLELAHEHWHQGMRPEPDVTLAAGQMPRRALSTGVAVVAAMLLIAATAGVWWSMRGGGGENMVAIHRDALNSNVDQTAPPPVETIDKVDQLLDDEAIAARLAASAAVLAEQAGAEEYGRSAYYFLARTFPHTVAGREAAALVSQTREITP